MSGVAQTRETDANLAPVTQVARAQFVRVTSAARRVWRAERRRQSDPPGTQSPAPQIECAHA